VFGDENLFEVFGWKFVACVKPHAQRGYMRTEVHCRRDVLSFAFIAELGILLVLSVTVWKAEVKPLFPGAIELIGGKVVTEIVAPCA
jgi:hypothetical protein